MPAGILERPFVRDPLPGPLAGLVPRLGVCAGSEQRFDDGGILVESGCKMQGSPTVPGNPRRAVRSGNEQRLDDGGVFV